MAPLPLDVTPTASPVASTRFDIVSPELLSAMGVVLPALAYPFMPSGTVWSCESALIWSSALNLIFFHYINMLAWASGFPYAHVQVWVLPLTFFSYIVGVSRLLPRHSGREPQQDDFIHGAGMAFCIAIYQLLKLGGLLFDTERAISLHNAISALIWGTGVLTVGAIVREPLTASVMTIFYQIATRRIRWWFWLPEDDVENNFQPFWSMILSIFVHISAPILVYFQVTGMDEIHRARQEAQRKTT